MKLHDIQLPGLRTDLELLLLEGKLTEREHYLKIETPENPAYYWGNYLVFEGPPTEADITRWPEIFAQEFNHEPRVRHCLLAWNSADLGAAKGFTGFEEAWIDTLTLDRNTLQEPSRLNSRVEVRALASDADWEAALENQVACRADGFARESYLEFKRAQMRWYRRLSEAGHGTWYGAFLDGRLAGDCGLFHLGPYGRFQAVGTHPSARGQGVCSSLIYEVAKLALTRSSTLVIGADPDYHAILLYEGVGFRRHDRILELLKRP